MFDAIRETIDIIKSSSKKLKFVIITDGDLYDYPRIKDRKLLHTLKRLADVYVIYPKVIFYISKVLEVKDIDEIEAPPKEGLKMVMNKIVSKLCEMRSK